MERLVSLIVLAAVLTGCQTKQTVRMYPSQAFGEGYNKSSPDPRYSSGEGRIGTVGNVRSSEVVKVYGVNRYVDPADPRLMHERHAVYRLEEQPGWVVQTPKGGNKILLGPIVGLNRAEYKPAPDSAELGRELMTSRRATEENNKYLDDVRSRLAVMETAIKTSLENQEKLDQVTKALADKIEQIDPSGGASQNQATPPPAAVRN
jgi:hypothetical protein